MQTKVKSNSVVTHSIVGETSIKFDVKGAGSFTFDYSKVAPNLRIRAERHGWIQRISDKAAIGSQDADGNLIREEDKAKIKFDAMAACASHYESGTDEWSMVSTSGEVTLRDLTVRAIAQVLKIDAAAAKEKVEAQAKSVGKTTRQLLNDYRNGKGKVRDAYIALRDAELSTDDSSDDLLAELMGEDEGEKVEAPKFKKGKAPVAA